MPFLPTATAAAATASTIASSLNQPALVASLGAGTLAALPKLEHLALYQLSIPQLKWINAATYLISLAAVSVPGRLDGQGENGTPDNPFLQNMVFAPASWAFGIWGIIFLGEMVFSVAQFSPLARSTTSLTIMPMASYLRAVSAYFWGAQIFQALWAASFRPKYKGKWMAVSAVFLPAIAYSLSKAHKVISVSTTSLSLLTGWQYAIFALPLTIHFGWTTAASLVNINGGLARMAGNNNNNNKDVVVSDRVLTLVGHGSVVAATALGMFVTLSRSAPVYGGVIAWALFGIADEMKRRLNTKNTKKNKRGSKESRPDNRRQQVLSLVGGFLTTATSLVVAILMKKK